MIGVAQTSDSPTPARILLMPKNEAETRYELIDPLLRDSASAINEYSIRFPHAAAGEQADDPDSRELTTYVGRTRSIIHG
jgi:hypothetical protein